MDKTNKTYNWNKLKDQLPEHHPKESLWDSISSSLDNEAIEEFSDAESAPLDFHLLKDRLLEHSPAPSIWDGISENLDAPSPQFDFNTLKDDLPTHQPKDDLWDNIAGELDRPVANFQFQDYKESLTEYSPDERLWDKIESGLEISETVDQLPSHAPPEFLWDKIEGELEEVKSGISIIKSAILIGLSMLFIIGAAIVLNQDDQDEVNEETMEQVEPIMFASNETIKVNWSDDEDVRLIQEMCQDYMAVCKQPEFKKLESELLELNEHKKELLNLVSDFDEESSYGPMIAKIENQKTALMKEMISMI